jgi:Tfp pilus assembly protein FimV
MPFFIQRPQSNFHHLLSCFMLTYVLGMAMTPVTAATEEASTSKRIEVYSLSQNYWDTQHGDTLGDIVHHLLPNNPSKRAALQQDILHLNPDAFIGGDPGKLLAGKRLWLPGYMKQADSIADPSTTTVETYSWGNIKRQRD